MLSFFEITIVVVAALLIFGTKKLPQMGRSLGESLTEFKKGLKEGIEEEPSDETIEGEIEESKTE